MCLGSNNESMRVRISILFSTLLDTEYSNLPFAAREDYGLEWWYTPVIPISRKLRLEDYDIKDTPGSRASPSSPPPPVPYRDIDSYYGIQLSLKR